MDILIILIFLIYKHRISFHLFVSSLSFYSHLSSGKRFCRLFSLAGQCYQLDSTTGQGCVWACNRSWLGGTSGCVPNQMMSLAALHIQARNRQDFIVEWSLRVWSAIRWTTGCAPELGRAELLDQ